MKISSRIGAIIHILDTVDTTDIPVDKLLSYWNKSNRYAGARDKAFIAHTVYDILRNRMACVWWCEKYAVPVNGYALVVVYMHFTCADRVAAAFFDTHNTFAPPPLNRSQQKLLSRLQSHPHLYSDDMPDFVRCNVAQWMYPLFESVYGDDTQAVLLSLNRQAPVDIRVNTLKSSVQQVVSALAKQGIDTTPLYGVDNGLRLQKRHSLSGVAAFKHGWFEIQDASSQRVSALVDAKRGDKVVDFCGGAGGKALAIAAQMANTGRIICCDVGKNRLQRAKIRLKRAGVDNTECRVLTSETDKWIKRRHHRQDGGFDKVVVDAPCTGTGTWRRNPDQKWRLSETDVRELTALQQRILQSASRLVRIGGRLIYMTCSLLPQENERQIQLFLGQNPHFELLPMGDVWRAVFGDYPVPDTTDTLRFHPPHINKTDAEPHAETHTETYDGDGFFIAIVTRKTL